MSHQKAHITCVPVSFETDDQGHGQAPIKVYFPSRVTVEKVRIQVQRELSAGDSGTITLYDVNGNSQGSATFAASSLVTTEGTITPTEFDVQAGDYIKLTPTKTTQGGEVLCFVEWSFKVL